MPRRLFDFRCEAGHEQEMLVDYETTSVTCLECGSAAHRQLSAPRINLEPFTGIFPSATSKWEKRRAEKLAQERKLNRDKDNS
jgi:hypothetical protein